MLREIDFTWIHPVLHDETKYGKYGMYVIYI